MSEEEKTGEQLLEENMAAYHAGEEVPYEEEGDLIQPEAPGAEPPAEEPGYAEKDGFMTKEDWVAAGNDPEDFLSQDDFERVGQMRDDKSISRQQMAKANVQMEAAMRDLIASNQEMIRKAEERARADERAKLQAQQKEAIEYGNTEEAIKIEREMVNLEREQFHPQEPQQPQVDAEVQAFYNENSYWYGKSQGATELLNVNLAKSEREGIPFNVAIGSAMAKVKKAYPDYFDEPKQPSQPQRMPPRGMSERGRAPAKREKRYTLNDLDEGLRPFARQAMKASNMSEHDYVKQVTERG